MQTLAFHVRYVTRARPTPKCRLGAYRSVLACSALAAVISFASAHAHAQAQAPVDDTTKNAARTLAHRAATAYDTGDYATAQDLFHRAYTLVPAPTIALREARALEKLGRLVESVEAYVRTIRTPLEPNAPEAFREAIQQANDELAKVKARVPELRIVVQGALPTDTLTVSLDGKPLRPALIGVEMPVNPGQHEIIASTNSGAGATQTVTLREAEAQVLELKLVPGTASNSPSQTIAHRVDSSSGAEGPSDGSAQRTWAYVGLGIGGAGLGTGVLTGLLAANRHSSAEDNCPDGKCTPGSSGAKDVDAFRSLRTISTLSYITGIVGVGAGLTLMLTAPKRTESSYVGPYVGIGRLGVQGRF